MKKNRSIVFEAFWGVILALNLALVGSAAAQTTPGTLDPTFGIGGQVVTDFSALVGFEKADVARDVAIQADGKIVVVGSGSFEPIFSLARYNPDGSLDTTFGEGGLVITSFGHTNPVTGEPGRESAFGIAIQADGKIVVAGFISYPGDPGTRGTIDFALARYNPDGSLDTSFGAGGLVTTDFDSMMDQARDLAIQSDGKIVVVGFTGPSLPSETPVDFALARYNPDGTLDVTFGTGGRVVTTDFNFTSFAESVAIQSDGKIVVAGSTAMEDATGHNFCASPLQF